MVYRRRYRRRRNYKRRYKRASYRAYKRRYKRRYRFRKRRGTYMPLGLGMGSKTFNFKYCEAVRLYPYTETYPDHYAGYRANGPADPSIDHVGHQPLHWDEIASNYRDHQVVCSKIIVKFSIKGLSAAANSEPLYVGIYGHRGTDTFKYGQPSLLRENAHGPSAVMHNVYPSSANATKTLVAYYSPRKVFGYGGQLQNDLLWAYGSDETPQTQWHWNLWSTYAINQHSTNDSTEVVAIVTIYYKVRFKTYLGDDVFDELPVEELEKYDNQELTKKEPMGFAVPPADMMSGTEGLNTNPSEGLNTNPSEGLNTNPIGRPQTPFPL